MLLLYITFYIYILTLFIYISAFFNPLIKIGSEKGRDFLLKLNVVDAFVFAFLTTTLKTPSEILTTELGMFFVVFSLTIPLPLFVLKHNKNIFQTQREWLHNRTFHFVELCLIFLVSLLLLLLVMEK